MSSEEGAKGSAGRVLSVFAGAGGLDLGVEAAGFEVIACIENDDVARRTLRANRPWPLVDPGDIAAAASSLTPSDLSLRRRELELLAAGPPCQPFSKAAQWSRHGRAGMIDKRSRCLHDLITLIDRFLPRVILIENVVGFIRGSGSALNFIGSALDDINQRERTAYRLAVKQLNAAVYGVPQRRERAILVALRDGAAFDWPDATHADSPVRAWDAIGKLTEQEKPVAIGKWADLLPSIPEGWNYQWHTDRGGGRPLFGYRTRFWSFLLKLAKDTPAWTIPAQPGPSTGPFHWDNRPLSVREMLRLQSFPASWSVAGDFRAQVRQIGNATPPLLAEVIARRIAELSCGVSFASRPKLRIARSRSVPSATGPASLPKRFREMEGSYPAHPGTGRGPSPILELADLAA